MRVLVGSLGRARHSSALLGPEQVNRNLRLTHQSYILPVKRERMQISSHLLKLGVPLPQRAGIRVHSSARTSMGRRSRPCRNYVLTSLFCSGE